MAAQSQPKVAILGMSETGRGWATLVAEAGWPLTIYDPDVVLLYLAMPDVNGWDFLQRIQETGHLGRIPVVVVSAHVAVQPQALLEIGVAAILPKPFNLPDLIDVIEHLTA